MCCNVGSMLVLFNMMYVFKLFIIVNLDILIVVLIVFKLGCLCFMIMILLFFVRIFFNVCEIICVFIWVCFFIGLVLLL